MTSTQKHLEAARAHLASAKKRSERILSCLRDDASREAKPEPNDVPEERLQAGDRALAWETTSH